MSASFYSVLAYIARYWFAVLVFIILWRAVLWLQKDADTKARRQSRLPDAGFIGEWVVLAPGDAMREGAALSAPRDGWMGSARGCDVRIRGAKVPPRAARFFLRRDGLHLQPERKSRIKVDGEPVRVEAILRHGATVTLGGITLQLRLFAGILLEGETIVDRRRMRTAPEESGAIFEEMPAQPMFDPVLIVSDETLQKFRRRKRAQKTPQK